MRIATIGWIKDSVLEQVFRKNDTPLHLSKAVRNNAIACDMSMPSDLYINIDTVCKILAELVNEGLVSVLKSSNKRHRVIYTMSEAQVLGYMGETA